MKAFQIAEVKRAFMNVLRDSQREDVVITRYGRPIAVLRGVEGQSMIDVVTRGDRKKRRSSR